MAVVFDPFELRRNGRRFLRQSTIGTADTCHKRLEFELNPDLPYYSSEARIQGTGYHAALDVWYGSLHDGLDLDILMHYAKEALDAELAICTPFEWETSYEAVLANTERMLRMYFDNGHGWLDHRFVVVATEFEFFLPFGTQQVKGAIDLVLFDTATGEYVLVDHKTSKKPWKAGKHKFRSTNQPAWYTHWWRECVRLQGGTVDRPVRFFFDIMGSDPAKPHWERREATATPLEIELVLGKANDLLHLLEQGGPFLPNTSSFLCHHSYCDFWHVCTFGAELG